MSENIKDRAAMWKDGEAPIVEVHFEIRWGDKMNIVKEVDFKYHAIFARFKKLFSERYPFYEYISAIDRRGKGGHIAYDFRPSKNGFPLIRIRYNGLSIHLDATSFMAKKDFVQICDEVLDKFFEEFKFTPNYLNLEYVDAFDIDLERENLHNFLKDKLKLKVEFENSIYKKVGLDDHRPIYFDLRNDIKVESLEGIFSCRVKTIKKEDGRDVLALYTSVRSEIKENIETEQMKEWIRKAKDFIYEWFFEMAADFRKL